MTTVPSPISQIYIFALVAFAWIFFRASSTEEAFKIIQIITTPSAYSVPSLSINYLEFIFCVGLILLLLFNDYYMQEYVPGKLTFWPSLITLSLLCYLFGVFDSNQFIYFQF